MLNTDLAVFWGDITHSFFPMLSCAFPSFLFDSFSSFLLHAMTSSMFRRRASLARQRPPSHQLMVKRATMSGSRRYLGKPPKRCLETSNQLHPRGPSTISIRKARTSVVSFSDFVSVSSFRTVTKGFITGSVVCMAKTFIFQFVKPLRSLPSSPKSRQVRKSVRALL